MSNDFNCTGADGPEDSDRPLQTRCAISYIVDIRVIERPYIVAIGRKRVLEVTAKCCFTARPYPMEKQHGIVGLGWRPVSCLLKVCSRESLRRVLTWRSPVRPKSP